MASAATQTNITNFFSSSPARRAGLHGAGTDRSADHVTNPFYGIPSEERSVFFRSVDTDRRNAEEDARLAEITSNCVPFSHLTLADQALFYKEEFVKYIATVSAALVEAQVKRKKGLVISGEKKGSLPVQSGDDLHIAMKQILNDALSSRCSGVAARIEKEFSYMFFLTSPHDKVQQVQIFFKDSVTPGYDALSKLDDEILLSIPRSHKKVYLCKQKRAIVNHVDIRARHPGITEVVIRDCMVAKLYEYDGSSTVLGVKRKPASHDFRIHSPW